MQARQLGLAIVLWSAACGGHPIGAPDGGAPDAGDPGNSPDGGALASCLAGKLIGALGKSHLVIGYSGEDSVAAQAPFDLRYEYLAGGLFDGAAPCASCASGCTAGGKSCQNGGSGCDWWGCWQSDSDPPGQYVRDLLAKTARAGEIPWITYYEVLHTSRANEGADEVTATANVQLMTRYFGDFRFLLQQIDQTPAVVHVEPDFWGYAQQLNSDPHAITSAVASANATDCGGEENSIAGFGRCLIKMARKYAPHAKITLHASDWSTGIDTLENSDRSVDVAAEAAKTATFLAACGAGDSDLIAVDYSDRDAGFYEAQGRNTWWDASNATLPNFTQAFAWTSAVATHAGKAAFVWQIPVGNASLGSSCTQWKDNRVDYLMAHSAEVARANIAGLAFGAGESCQTNPSTDGGNLIAKTRALAANGGQAACP